MGKKYAATARTFELLEVQSSMSGAKEDEIVDYEDVSDAEEEPATAGGAGGGAAAEAGGEKK